MNEVLKAIETRFSNRGFKGDKIDEDKMKAIAKAALHAPSAINRQPWRLIVINDKDIVSKLDDSALVHIKSLKDQSFYNRIMERGGKVFYDAPALYLILKEKGWRWSEMDAGIMTQNITLAAHSLGLDSVIVATADFAFQGEDSEEIKKLIKWSEPEKWEFAMGVLVGEGTNKKDPHEIDWEKVVFV
ncbi:MAG: nitroreductase family protein [Defluviitaleaceae bacterium]|nr:nitroreductase family protein [Defluviitaleaceae bacterium]